jgi:tight adherence protein B
MVSFAAVTIFTRPTAAQKTVALRLGAIRSPKTSSHAELSAHELVTISGSRANGLLLALLERYGCSQQLNRLILHAGSSVSAVSVIATSAGLALVGGLFAHLFFPLLPIEVAAALAAAALPFARLKFQCSRRLKAVNLALPDSIDLLARSLRAGHSLSSAIEVVVAQAPQPLAAEFQQVSQQQQCGIPFRDAIVQLTNRIPSNDVHFLVTAILVQKETGGDLTEVLDRTVDVIRDRMRIEGEINTYTAQGRLTGWILALLPIIILIMINIVNPQYSQVFFRDSLGQKLLCAGGVLIIVGGLIIRSIVNIEV